LELIEYEITDDNRYGSSLSIIFDNPIIYETVKYIAHGVLPVLIPEDLAGSSLIG
jgi:hypothetical protein